MKIRSPIFLFGALTISAPCFATTDVPVVPMVGSSDYQFLKIEKDLPEFGGMFIDENGSLNVYMLHPDGGASAVDTPLRASPLLSGKEAAAAINVLQGQFSFSTLARWRDRLLPALALKGVVFLDIDEMRNRVVIGVSDPATKRIVKSRVIASKIPQNAVIVEIAAPFHQLKTLNDTFRPVIGGVEIGNGSGACTLGFNAIIDGRRGFVTNSHCTAKQGQVDSTRFRQAAYAFMADIGTEVIDPPYLTSSLCPSGKGCRYSDSVFANYDSGIESTLGALARTFETEGGTLLDETNPLYVIAREDCGALGDLVYKEGAATGYTTARISRTCVAVGQEDPTNALLPCQNLATTVLGDAVAARGDSGSPVFTYNSNGTVTLAGLVFAGATSKSDDPDKFIDFAYSCIGSIKADLGQQLITYQPPSGQPLITNVTFPSSIPGDSAPYDGTVTFTDSDAGITRAQFDVLQATCDPTNPSAQTCFPSFGFDPGVKDLKDGQFTFTMWCEGDFYWNVEFTLSDVQGNVSNPWLFTVKCDQISARATAELSVGRGAGGGP